MQFRACVGGFLLLLIGLSGAVGQTWVRTTAPAKTWACVSSSADGSCLAAAAWNGPIYVSTNSGATWLPSSVPSTNWLVIASSAAGDALVALQSAGDYVHASTIYRSTNFGFTWFPLSAPSNHWWGVACSGDGTKLVACAPHAAVTLSTDSGATWSQPSIPDGPWDTIAYSADGTRIMTTGSDADVYNSPLAVSADSGATWSITNFRIWGFRAACSASAENIIEGVYSGVYVSQDFGATWRLTGLPTNLWWRAVASSAHGTRLIAALSDYSLRTTNSIYTSSDAGQTWTLNEAPNTNWISVASSADGCKLVAAVGTTISGFIYRAQSVPQPVLKTRLSGTNLVLSWIVPSAPFVLQETDDVTNPNWSALPLVPVLNTSTLENEVTLPLRIGNSFYRLKGFVN